jgi:ketosteroid isomerase-like protein
MTAQQNKEIVEQFHAAGNRGDMETCFNLIADDINWTNIGTTSFSGTFRVKEELTEKLLGPHFGQLKSGIHTQVHRLIAENDHVVALTSGTAESTDGRPYNNTYCPVIRVRAGKFAEVTEYMDTALVALTLDWLICLDRCRQLRRSRVPRPWHSG